VRKFLYIMVMVVIGMTGEGIQIFFNSDKRLYLYKNRIF
jgi:hypothetical protein